MMGCWARWGGGCEGVVGVRSGKCTGVVASRACADDSESPQSSPDSDSEPVLAAVAGFRIVSSAGVSATGTEPEDCLTNDRGRKLRKRTRPCHRRERCGSTSGRSEGGGERAMVNILGTHHCSAKDGPQQAWHGKAFKGEVFRRGDAHEVGRALEEHEHQRRAVERRC